MRTSDRKFIPLLPTPAGSWVAAILSLIWLAVPDMAPAAPHAPGDEPESSFETQAAASTTFDLKRGVQLTITDVGSFGYSEGGLGFRLPGGLSGLYHGGVILGRSSLQVSDAAYGWDTGGASGNNSDFVPDDRLVTEFSGAMLRSRYTDDDALYPSGLEVDETVWTHPDHTFAIVNLSITSHTSVPDFHVGLYSDWDVGTYDKNVVGVGTDPTFGYQFSFVRDSDPSTQDSNYYGSAVISHPGSNNKAVYNPVDVYPIETPPRLPMKLFWVNSQGDGEIQSGDRDGNGPTTLEDSLWLSSIALDPHRSKIYMSDPSNGTVTRANSDGSGYETIVTGQPFPDHVALDLQANKVYWADQIDDVIKRAELDGSNVETVLSGLGSVTDVAIETEAGKIYWTENLAGGGLYRANLDGSNMEHLIISSGGFRGLALAPEMGWLYYAESSTIYRANLDGTNILTIAIGQSSPSGLAWDPFYDDIYWTDWTADKVVRADFDGVPLEEVYTTGADGAVEVALEIHQTNSSNRLYWTNYQDEALRRATLSGGLQTDLISSSDGSFKPSRLEIDFAAGKLYWVESLRQVIHRANLDGTAIEVVANTGSDYVNGIHLDSTRGYLYWADGNQRRIRRVSVNDPGTITDILTGLGDIWGLAVDPRNSKVYWVEVLPQRVKRANLDGTGVEDLITTGFLPEDIALDIDAGKMYWTDIGEGKVRRANLDGSGEEDLVTGLSSPSPICLDLEMDRMYWADIGSDKIQRASLDGSFVEDLVTETDGLTGLALALEDPGFEDRTKYGLMSVSGSTPGNDPSDWSTLTSTGPFFHAYVDTLEVAFVLAGASDSASLASEISAAIDLWQNSPFDLTAIYWSSGDQVQAADTEAGVAAPLATTLLQAIDVAVDILGGKVYWADEAAGTISRADLDGTNLETPVVGQGQPMALELDLANEKIYWSTHQNSESKVRRTDLSGGAVEDLFSIFVDEIRGISLDPVENTIYFTTRRDIGSQFILRFELDPLLGGPIVSKEQGAPAGIALDLRAGKVYWADTDSNKIQRANLDGSNVEDLVSTGLTDPYGIDLDPARGKIYWSDSGSHKIQRADTSGASVEDVVTSISGSPFGIALGGGPPQIVDVVEEQPLESITFSAGPVYPNPSTSGGVIRFSLPEQANVTVQIHDASGRLVRSLVKGERTPVGHHAVLWEGRDQNGRRVRTGVYFYSVEAGPHRAAGKMVIIR